MVVTSSAVVSAIQPGGGRRRGLAGSVPRWSGKTDHGAEGDEDEQVVSGHEAPLTARIGRRQTFAPSIAPSPPRCGYRDGHRGPTVASRPNSCAAVTVALLFADPSSPEAIPASTRSIPGSIAGTTVVLGEF
jgi:hypothetical protein